MSLGLTVENIRLSLRSGCLDQSLDALPSCEGSIELAADRIAALDMRIEALSVLRNRLAAELARTQDAVRRQRQQQICPDTRV